ncbi:MAG: alkaline shock response membrane anchor protein AmaP [Syntrophaceticus sp.]
MRRQNLFFQVISALIIIIISGCVFAVALNWIQPFAVIDNFLAVPENRWGVAAGSVVLILLSIWALVAAFRTPRERDVVIQESGLGRVEITTTALESLIRRAARDVRDVRDVKPILRMDQDGLVVILHMNVNPEANLPDISRDVQEIVQENLEKKAGVQVSKVQVLIQSVAADIRPRVE